MLYYLIVAIILLFLPMAAFGQSAVSDCNAPASGENCLPPSSSEFASFSQFTSSSLVDPVTGPSSDDTLPAAPAPQPSISGTIKPDASGSSSEGKKESFRWGRALKEAGTFLVIEQAWVVHTDFPWVVSEKDIPFNHYWRDYKQSLERWWEVGWSAGENPMYNYVGHPIQGAITEYIFFQNDPKSRYLEFSKSKQYWLSRVKATIFNGVYSTQWSIGPISEMTVEKYGSNDRPQWTASGAFPCNPKIQQCYWGVGKVNLVMTPVGGLGWVLAEDWMDKNIVRRVERKTTNRLLIDTTRCTFNPIRAAGNILHGNRPWFRFRDVRDANSSTLH
ncbi:MAG: hypothetical protein WA252_20460 [Candidatus Sulfotelmatobacter sp.]